MNMTQMRFCGQTFNNEKFNQTRTNNNSPFVSRNDSITKLFKKSPGRNVRAGRGTVL